MKNPSFSIGFVDEKNQPTSGKDYHAAIVEVGDDTPIHFRVIPTSDNDVDIITNIIHNIAAEEFNRLSDSKHGQSVEVILHTIKQQFLKYGIKFTIVEKRFDNNS